MRLILADDHTALVDALSLYMSAIDPSVTVTACRDLDSAIAAAKAGADFALLDLHMPGMRGVPGVARFRAEAPGVPCAVFSGHWEPDLLDQVLAAGASGFIPKSIKGEGLLHAIRMMLAGECYIPSLILDTMRQDPSTVGLPQRSAAQSAETVSVPTPGVSSDASPTPLANLSERERAVVEQLKKGYSNKEIARALGLEEGTVKQYLRTIFKKLAVRNRTQALQRALSS